MMQVIRNVDYFLLPVYLLLALLIIRKLKSKLNPDTSTHKIYYIAFLLKVVGALLFAIIIQYYYGISDSLTYFEQARNLHDNVVDNIWNIKYFFCSLEEYKTINILANNNITSVPYDLSGLMTVRITALITFLSFNTFLTTTILFAIISFLGMWALYLIFILKFPLLKKQFAWGILYLPGVIFWSSGILKDTISMAALGLLFYSFYQYFIFKKKKVTYPLIISLTVYVIFIIKYYIITAFLITFLVVGVLYIFFKINPIYKRIILSVMLIILFCLLIFTKNFISDNVSKFSINMITENIERMQGLYLNNKEAVDGNFSINTIDPSFAGILSKIPWAISTVLYRPFIWESKSIIMIFSGLENLILLILSAYVLIRAGVINFFKLMAQNSLVQFCFFFTIIFAMIVGFTTFNFGTMLRYKVPCIPFYTSFLILVNYYTILKKRSGIIRLI